MSQIPDGITLLLPPGSRYHARIRVYRRRSQQRHSVACTYRGLQGITECNFAYDSLHYVLLFPSGDNGWHLKIPHSRGKGDVTALEYYSSRLMVRIELSTHVWQTLPSVLGGYDC